MIICVKCKSVNQDNNKRCNYCGYELGQNSDVHKMCTTQSKGSLIEEEN